MAELAPTSSQAGGTKPPVLHWRQRPAVLLGLFAVAMPLAHATWMALLNNFVVERAAFTGAEIGILQSLREVPGFLSFTAIFLVLAVREQTLALVMLALLGIGVAATGYFPTAIGLYCTTVLMSIGFHFYETMNQSLSLQWLSHDEAPKVLGKLVSVTAFASLASYGLIYGMLELLGADYRHVYLVAGSMTLAITLAAALLFPRFKAPHPQRKTIILRSRYWLYYALTFFAGARRQIFVVFALFLLVEKLGFTATQIVALLVVNHLINMMIGPLIGRAVAYFGERNALVFEYIGLILIFGGYAIVDDPWIAGGLYVLDHVFFALAIAMRTYFQKIADPGDIAGTAGVSFSINHIAAVVIPALFGMIWVSDHTIVFYAGAGFAVLSLICALMVPRVPQPGNETILTAKG